MTRSSTDHHEIDRRTFVAAAGVAGVAAAAALSGGESAAQESGAVPNSSGTEAPSSKRRPEPATAITTSTTPASRSRARRSAHDRRMRAVGDYRMLQRRLGTEPQHRRDAGALSGAVADNSVTLDALAAFGANARGVAIVYPAITDAELQDARTTAAFAASGSRSPAAARARRPGNRRR